jgi:imidazolonepropionase-like amidohydrolase
MKMGTNALELELLVKYGKFSPMESLMSMTKHGAMACGLESQIGTIEEGKLADIIVVRKDPLEDIQSLQKKDDIELVLKEGKLEVSRGNLSMSR